MRSAGARGCVPIAPIIPNAPGTGSRGSVDLYKSPCLSASLGPGSTRVDSGRLRVVSYSTGCEVPADAVPMAGGAVGDASGGEVFNNSSRFAIWLEDGDGCAGGGDGCRLTVVEEAVFTWRVAPADSEVLGAVAALNPSYMRWIK